jgi:hypothetical protein
MELAGLEPAPSWVRSSRPLTSKVLRLQRFMGERLECRNISLNSLHHVLQRHEIPEQVCRRHRRARASTSMERRGRVGPEGTLREYGPRQALAFVEVPGARAAVTAQSHGLVRAGSAAARARLGR